MKIHTAKAKFKPRITKEEEAKLNLPKFVTERGWGNGYIGIEKDHPWYEVHYDDIPMEVHWGLTYSAHWNCETQERTPDIWWIGFDTQHLDDNEENCSESFVDGQIELMKKQAEEAMR